MASAFVDRAYWLIPIGLGFAAVLALSLWLPSWWDDGIGQRRYEPIAASQIDPDYRLGVGELVVDLSRMPVQPGSTRVDLDVGIGSAVVIVPRDVDLDIDARTDIGEVELLERDHDGSRRLHYDAPGTDATIVVDAEVERRQGRGAPCVGTACAPSRWPSDWPSSPSPSGPWWRPRGTAPPAGSPPFCSSPLALQSSPWQSCGDGTATAPSAREQ